MTFVRSPSQASGISTSRPLQLARIGNRNRLKYANDTSVLEDARYVESIPITAWAQNGSAGMPGLIQPQEQVDNEQTNMQLVQQAYQFFKPGNVPSFLNLLAEDVLWQLPEMANVPFAGTWKEAQ